MIHSSLLYVANSSFLPAELTDLAETFGLNSGFDSVRKWTLAAIELRTKYKMENPERVSFVLEDAALVKNQMEALAEKIVEPVYYDAFSEPGASEAFVEVDHQDENIDAMLELERRLRYSDLIPSLLTLWKQLEGQEKNLRGLLLAGLERLQE